MRFVTRSKRNRDLGKKIRLLTERMGVPPSIHNKIMITEERIKENAKLYNFNHSWEESMAVVISNFYEENFCSSEPYSTLKELCKKADVPDKELDLIISAQVTEIKFKALKFGLDGLVFARGYSWNDILAKAVKDTYEENNKLYLACNKIGVPKQDFYDIFLHEDAKIERRIGLLTQRNEIESFFSDQTKKILAISDIYYEGIREFL